LAFAICGERAEKPSKTAPSKTSTKRHLLAKYLPFLLGAVVRDASGFAQPGGIQSNVKIMDGLRATRAGGTTRKEEPWHTGDWGKTEDQPLVPLQEQVRRAQATQNWPGLRDGLSFPFRQGNQEGFDDVETAEVNGRLDEQDDDGRKAQFAAYLEDLSEEDAMIEDLKLEKLWLLQVENANIDAVVGERLLAKMYDETSFLSSEAEWEALEDGGLSFQKWQENVQERYATIWTGRSLGLETLKGTAFGLTDKLLKAQQKEKKEKISDILKAAELGQSFKVDGKPREEYDNLEKHLQSMKGKTLEDLWRSTKAEDKKSSE